MSRRCAWGPDGVVLGPNKASAQVDRTADLAQGTLGIDNLHLGPNGVLINNGSPLNSSVKVPARWPRGPLAPVRCMELPSALSHRPLVRVVAQVTQNGLVVQGNPTGSGLSHFFVKPNLRLGSQQVRSQPDSSPS